MDKKMIKLFGVTFTYNESVMIPYVMSYFERMGFDKLIVYDNMSTDDTVKLLKKYPFVEVRPFDTGGKKSNREMAKVKSDAWKEFQKEQNAWIYIGDFDEVLYYNGDFKSYLNKMSIEGYDYLNQPMIEILSETFPVKDKLAHESVKKGSIWGGTNTGGAKMTLFKIHSLWQITYAPGAHRVTARKNKSGELKSLNGLGIKSFHLKYIDKTYCLARKKVARDRRGPDDIKRGYGSQYMKSDEVFINNWKEKLKNGILIEDYLAGKVDTGDVNTIRILI